MNNVELGQLITTPQQRDAVHVAVIPLIAGESLQRGECFRLKHRTNNVALRGEYNNPSEVLGVVDPFLTEYYVEKNQEFWGLLYPNTVTGMRHHWKHPRFDNTEITVDPHKLWLLEFCDKYNFDFDQLIEAGDSGEYVVARGIDLHSAKDLDMDEEAEFWKHLEAYTGKTYDMEHKKNMVWSCSC